MGFSGIVVRESRLADFSITRERCEPVSITRRLTARSLRDKLAREVQMMETGAGAAAPRRRRPMFKNILIPTDGSERLATRGAHRPSSSPRCTRRGSRGYTSFPITTC